MADKDVSCEYPGILAPGERVLEAPNGMRYFVLPPGMTSEEADRRNREVQAAFREMLEQEEL